MARHALRQKMSKPLAWDAMSWHSGWYRGRTVRCAHAVRALCEKLAALHHREFGKFRRLKGRH